MTDKICGGCLKAGKTLKDATQPESNFWRNCNWCKDCKKAAYRKHYANNKDVIRNQIERRLYAMPEDERRAKWREQWKRQKDRGWKRKSRAYSRDSFELKYNKRKERTY